MPAPLTIYKDESCTKAVRLAQSLVFPSELIAFDFRLAEFRSRSVEVIGVSIDSTLSSWPGRTPRGGSLAIARR